MKSGGDEAKERMLPSYSDDVIEEKDEDERVKMGEVFGWGNKLVEVEVDEEMESI